MDVSAKINGIIYTPFLCRRLEYISINDLEHALSNNSNFVLKINEDSQIAVSWWVSPKRTRSYPYARIYDTLGFQGKKVTIIPIIKDEGLEGDRDFLQWDTISLMSLLGIYTIISYYDYAVKSSRYVQKITNQRFCIRHLNEQINLLLSYQSDALHWNLNQIDEVGTIGLKALDSYEIISKKLSVEMHSRRSAEHRIQQLRISKDNFMKLSRKLAEEAQNREAVTTQPKENLVSGTKATLTIRNYLGGLYYFTADEIHIEDHTLYLVEGKHSKGQLLPSLGDIKDGLFKMILFTNLKDVRISGKEYLSIAALKLTSEVEFSKALLNEAQIKLLELLKAEAEKNNFRLVINDTDLKSMRI